MLCHVDGLLQTMDRLHAGAPPGVWVCSTEMLVSLPRSPLDIEWEGNEAGMKVLAVRGDPVSPPPPSTHHNDETMKGTALRSSVLRGIDLMPAPV
jgi:hypothetical protein